MDRVTELIQEWTSLPPSIQGKLLGSLAVVVVLSAARLVVTRLLHRRMPDVTKYYYWRRSVTYAATGLGVLIVGFIWLTGSAVGSIATFLGLVSAGLAIAMHDTVSNLTGWAFILWRQPFKVGDRIQIGESAGDVIDVRLFQFSLLEIGNWVDADQSTGRILHVPNGLVLRERLANYTSGFKYVWHEIPVLVTFESDWEKAKQVLRELADRHTMHLSPEAQNQVRETTRKYMIVYNKLTPTVYTSVRDSGVLLTIRHICLARQRRSVEEALWEAILREFGACDDIEFAYPTIRRYDNRLEGPPISSEKGE